MAETTGITWTDSTFNPWVGCTKVAPGCANCYAAADMDNRRHFAKWGPRGTRVRTSDANWAKPKKWNKEAQAAGVRRRVFCSSLADVFEDWQGLITDHSGRMLSVTDQEPGRHCPMVEGGLDAMEAWHRKSYEENGYRPTTMNDLRGDLFRLIDSTPWLDWQLLTKRPGNVPSLWPSRSDFEYIPEAGTLNEFNEFHRDNVHLGTSVSEQQSADENVPKLLLCAKLVDVLFISAEPLLGPIDLTCLQHDNTFEVNALTGAHGVTRPLQGAGPHINWVIIGGESGHDARPCRPQWIRSIATQCREAKVPYFVKQMGANVISRNDMIEDTFNNGSFGWPEPETEHDIHGYRENFQGADCRIILHDKKGGDPMEWPKDLRVRKFPSVT